MTLSIDLDYLVAAFPRLYPIFGLPAPLEGPHFVGVVMGDEGLDGGDALDQRVEDRVLMLLPVSFVEKPSTAFVQDAEVDVK